MRSKLFAFLAILASAAAAQAQAPNAGPVAYEVLNRKTEAAVEVLVIEFQAQGSDFRTQAILVRPTSAGPHPGVLYLHKLGPGGSSGQFREEAMLLAAKGVICLLPQGRVPWKQKWSGDELDLPRGRAQLAEFSAALSLLEAEAGVDRQRILLVGHDYGAMFGLVLAAANPGISAMAFLAFAPRFSDWKDYFSPRKNLSPAVYDEIMAPLDPMKALEGLKGRRLFLQFAASDGFVSPQTVAEIRAAAGEGSVFDIVSSQGTDHENLHQNGSATRLAWMERQLFGQ